MKQETITECKRRLALGIAYKREHAWNFDLAIARKRKRLKAHAEFSSMAGKADALKLAFSDLEKAGITSAQRIKKAFEDMS